MGKSRKRQMDCYVHPVQELGGCLELGARINRPSLGREAVLWGSHAILCKRSIKNVFFSWWFEKICPYWVRAEAHLAQLSLFSRWWRCCWGTACKRSLTLCSRAAGHDRGFSPAESFVCELVLTLVLKSKLAFQICRARKADLVSALLLWAAASLHVALAFFTNGEGRKRD